jgi:hypothetical protein
MACFCCRAKRAAWQGVNLERYAAMADETPETLRAEIAHKKRLALLVTDAGVRTEIEKMIEELERRLRGLEER